MIIPWLLSAATIYVNKNATGTNTGASWVNAYSNLQDAVTAAVAGDMVLVTNGVYSPITTGNKAITIQSVNGSSVTSIDGSGATRCATLGTVSTYVNTVLNGFTLTNGFTTGNGGGSIYGTLTGCTISGNMANYGGGTYGGTLTGCTISGNTANARGGGSSASILFNTIVSNNIAIVNGGGCYNGTLNSCLVVGNIAPVGSQIRNQDFNFFAYNSTIIGTCSFMNTTRNIFNNIFYDANVTFPVTAQVGFNIFSGTFTGGTIIGPNLTSTDPLFTDPLNNDFTLQPSSPCIDAGSNMYADKNTWDLAGNPRISGGTVDMGAYEFKKVWLAKLPSHMNPMGKSLEPKGPPIPAVAWYKLDGNALDSSGNGYDGTWVGTEAYTNDGAYFDGNSRIIVNSTVGNIASNGALTVSLWARDVETNENDAAIEGLVSKVQDVNNARPGWGFYKRSTHYGLFSRHSQGINTYIYNLFISNRSLEVWNGTWRHLAIVYDPTTGRSYGFYNGALTEGSGPWPVADGMSNDKNLTLGATSGGTGASVGMSLKDVRIYSRVLSPANIQRIMESQDNEPLEELQ